MKSIKSELLLKCTIGCEVLVVDVFPTLTDLAGLVEPIGVDGSSLVPAMLRSIENRENINAKLVNK